MSEIRHVTRSAEYPATVNSTLTVPVIIILIKEKHFPHIKDFQRTTCFVQFWGAEPGPKDGSQSCMQRTLSGVLEEGPGSWGGNEQPSLSTQVEQRTAWKGCHRGDVL